jgi:hypothetical protein
VRQFQEPVPIRNVQRLQFFELPEQATRIYDVMAAALQLENDLFLTRNMTLTKQNMPFGLLKVLQQHRAFHSRQ